MLSVHNFTVGNTINVAVAIYKHNFRKFLKLSFLAHLWLLVPIYGWARYFAIAAWIGRSSFNLLLDGEENNLEKEKYLTVRSLFLFLLTALINVSIIIFIWCAAIILFTFITLFLEEVLNSAAIGNFMNSLKTQTGIGYWIFFWSFMAALLLISILVHSIFFVSDLCFDSENKNKLFGSICKSWTQTKKSRLKLLIVITTSLAISLPLYISVYLIFYFFMSPIFRQLNLFEWDFFYYGVIVTDLFTSALAHAALLPFWQSIKAVTFYQLTDLERKYSLR